MTLKSVAFLNCLPSNRPSSSLQGMPGSAILATNPIDAPWGNLDLLNPPGKSDVRSIVCFEPHAGGVADWGSCYCTTSEAVADTLHTHCNDASKRHLSPLSTAAIGGVRTERKRSVTFSPRYRSSSNASSCANLSVAGSPLRRTAGLDSGQVCCLRMCYFVFHVSPPNSVSWQSRWRHSTVGVFDQVHRR